MSDEQVATRVRAAIEAHGATRTARRLGLSVEATCKIAGALPVHAGTRMVAREHVSRLDGLDAPKVQR